MTDYIGYLPLLNLLNVPIVIKILAVWVRSEVRLAKLETHQERVEIHLGFKERRSES